MSMFEGSYDDLVAQVKTAMKNPEKWTLKYFNIKCPFPNADSFARFVKGHKQGGYTDQELVDKVVLMLQRNMTELLPNEQQQN